MPVVSEMFDMCDVRNVSEKVVISIVTCLERIGHEVPNEVPSYLLDDMVDECILNLMSDWPKMSDLSDMIDKARLDRKWTIAIKCAVMAEMYGRLDMPRESARWQKRMNAAYESFAALLS